ncbi:MAG: hypothetical protein EOO53_22440 [Gammaproteobacteria bacterium]|nr:MAG: hypothetical protein EOO53_22440 [Gammaproteobacteria bacterium]
MAGRFISNHTFNSGHSAKPWSLAAIQRTNSESMRFFLIYLVCLVTSEMQAQTTPPGSSRSKDSFLIETIYTESVIDCITETDTKSGKPVWKFIDEYSFIMETDSLTGVSSAVFYRGKLVELISFTYYHDKLVSIDIHQTRLNLPKDKDGISRFSVHDWQLVHVGRRKVNEVILARYFDNARRYLARSKTFTKEDRASRNCR